MFKYYVSGLLLLSGTLSFGMYRNFPPELRQKLEENDRQRKELIEKTEQQIEDMNSQMRTREDELNAQRAIFARQRRDNDQMLKDALALMERLNKPENAGALQEAAALLEKNNQKK